MKENKNMKCDPCEQNFEQNIDRIVHQGEAPTREERRQKSSELKEAFAAEHAADKTAEPKQPAMAGMDKAKK